MKEMSDIGLQRSRQGCGRSIRQTAWALLWFYGLAMLLNGEALLRDVQLMRYGQPRDVGVAIFTPVAWASRVTGAGALRAWLENNMQREPGS